MGTLTAPIGGSFRGLRPTVCRRDHCQDPYHFFFSRRDQIVGLATRRSMPAIYYLREYATAGGLMSYGTNVTDAYRRARFLQVSRVAHRAFGAARFDGVRRPPRMSANAMMPVGAEEYDIAVMAAS